MKKIVVLTGAGMSAESGISTFRDAGGLWEQYNVADVATPEGYARDPLLVTNFYNHLRQQLCAAQPCEGHKLVAALEKDFDVTVVTQNVDNLHERAGSHRVVHLHGELMKVTSSNSPENLKYVRELPPDHCEVKMGDKADDGSQLRPFIVWFGEAVPEMETAVRYAQETDIFIIIGTSLNVYPAAGLLYYVPASAPVFLIDPKPVTVPSDRHVTVIQKGASDGMKELTAILQKMK